ncbi:Phospholipase ddhd1 [Mortierella sp. GBA30]|nr:Phospholipase ddhd1 [Mortierella sp. GBA30]
MSASNVHGDTAESASEAASVSAAAAESTSSSSIHSEPISDSTPADQHSHHVIFVVHGMGRQLEEFGNYERNVGHLVENTKTVLQSQFHDLKTNVHIIPIEWHAKLHSMVDERMALASLRTVPKVRLVMNDYFADILYYFNNHFGSEIVRMIVEELNEAYETFLAKHPDFTGKISVYALSLGGVAMFDILTCLDDDDDDDDIDADEIKAKEKQKDRQNASSKSKGNGESEGVDDQEPSKKRPRIRKQDQSKFRAVVPKLKFRPDYLFTVGSPVGAVMVMRNLNWETFHPPDDIIHHNLFHPFDPLGYRIEPLIDPVFAGIPAMTISSYGASSLLPSISLPSILSSFWENRVPALPRPSIPTLSSISQMTQSLKAGRWLSTGTNTDGNEGDDVDVDVDQGPQPPTEANENSGTSTPTTKVDGTQDQDEGDATSAATHSRVATKPTEGKGGPSDSAKSQSRSTLEIIMDGDVSVTEYMAAATVATYLDQSESTSRSGSGSSSRPADPDTYNDTTTLNTTTINKRRPSLGPRTVSSQVEHEDESTKAGVQTTTMPRVPEEDNNSTSQVEYYVDMEEGRGGGATDEEKARCVGAKSDVVQESMIRSLPENTHSPGDNKGFVTNGCGLDHPIGSKKEERKKDEEKVGITTTESRKGSLRTVHVEGRPTNVPYRIDHVLQETTVDQYTNEYLLGMRSHFRYWDNRDIAYHILRTMLQPASTMTGEGDVLDLKLPMPTPVTTTKGAKEAAESKAKATAQSLRASASSSPSVSGTVDQETKRQNRMSFTFSFFGGQQADNSNSNTSTSSEEQLQREQEQRRRQEEVDEDFAMMDEEGELFGYRYSDLDMSHSANASSLLSKGAGSTLFQNSPFAPGAYASDLSNSRHMTTTVTATTTSQVHSGSSKRRISLQLTKKSETEVTSTTTSGEFDEGVIIVPDLARPAKLHHRSSRVEEKR